MEEIRASLTEDQPAAFDQLLAFMEDESRYYYLVTGFAGTGKTTLIVAFVEAYLTIDKKCEIAVTATTNKAVVVLANKADFVSYRVNYRTIHSQFHLKQRYDDFGNIFFDVNGSRENDLPEELKVIIIDEGSMIDKKLHKIILEKTQGTHVKVIFVGDFYQIPPVGERIAQIALPEVQDAMGMCSVHLSTVVRQAAGNPIIQLATYVREHENDKILDFDYKDDITEEGSIILLDRTDKERVFKVIDYLFANDYFADNPDYVKVLAWRNDVVNKINHVIRKMIYGDEAKQSLLLPGEKLIANKPIKDLLSNNVLFTTNSEFEVLTAVIAHKTIEGETFKYWKTRVVQKLTDPENMRIIQRVEIIDILHPESTEDFNKLTSKLKKPAIRWSGTPMGRGLWRAYYEVMEHFADVKYNYALTSHKAQGSTFRSAIILEKDICSNPTMPERNRLLYVAYTRPATNLILVR